MYSSGFVTSDDAAVHSTCDVGGAGISGAVCEGVGISGAVCGGAGISAAVSEGVAISAVLCEGAAISVCGGAGCDGVDKRG